jgi:hypothetical protein
VQLKENKNRPDMTVNNTKKRLRTEIDYEHRQLNSSVIPQTIVPKFSDLAKKLEMKDFASNKPRKSIIMGAKKEQAIKLYISDRKFSVWLGHINIKESEESIKTLLCGIADELNIEISDIDRIPVSHKKFQSYKFTVPYMDRDKIMNPEIWPENLAISRYTSPNPNRRTDNFDQRDQENKGANLINDYGYRA